MWVPIALLAAVRVILRSLRSRAQLQAGDEVSRWVDDGVICLACDEAFEAARDLGCRLALGAATRNVGLSWCVVAHAHQDDGVERVVGSPVTAAVESVTLGLA